MEYLSFQTRKNNFIKFSFKIIFSLIQLRFKVQAEEDETKEEERRRARA
jgi:hypothetical protein